MIKERQHVQELLERGTGYADSKFSVDWCYYDREDGLTLSIYCTDEELLYMEAMDFRDGEICLAIARIAEMSFLCVQLDYIGWIVFPVPLSSDEGSLETECKISDYTSITCTLDSDSHALTRTLKLPVHFAATLHGVLGQLGHCPIKVDDVEAPEIEWLLENADNWCVIS